MGSQDAAVTAPPRPPEQAPPTLFTRVYAEAEAGEQGQRARIVDGRLLLSSSTPQQPTGFAATSQRFRDVILDTRLSLEEGGDDAAYGVYLRQSEGHRYVAWGVTPSGHCLVGLVDAGWQPLVDAALAADLPFARGRGAANRFQVVACGPALTFVLNGAVVTGVTVDRRYAEGALGYWLLQGPSASQATIAVDWVQVRAVLPGQPERA